MEWLKNKKTYFIAILVGVAAGLKYLGVVVPEWVYPLLGALGLATLRAAITKVVK